MLDEMYKMVERFNLDVLGVPPQPKPTRLDGPNKDYAVELLQEELTEFVDAQTLEGEVDAMIDLAYVALGRLVEMGITPLPVFQEVHERNMAKVRGHRANRSVASPGEHDAVKPEGWTPPDLSPYLTVTKADIDWLVETKKHLNGSHLNSVRFFKPGNHILPKAGTEEKVTIDKPEAALPERRWTKILVLGYSRHGKDTAAEILRDRYNLRFTSSSIFCAEHVVMPRMMQKYGVEKYPTVEACFEDRHNCRDEWYQIIRDYNRPDASALGRAIFASHDIYCGLRSKAEFNALKNAGVVDHIIWIDRLDHLPIESRESCTVEPWMADHVVDNNGTVADLRFNLEQLMNQLMDQPL
ncbi:MAG: hypothetical protein V3S55_15315 [Nitrospiraceae bacterium]